MKRTPLNRGQPLKRTPMKRGKPLPQVNKARQKRRKAITGGPQSDLVRTLPCCNCGRVPWEECPTIAHHWPTVANGGTDSDVSGLCFACHVPIFHDQCGSAAAFLELTGTDVIEVARLLAEKIKEDS